MVEGSAEALVKAIEQQALMCREGGVAGDGIQKTGGEGSVEAVEEL